LKYTPVVHGRSMYYFLRVNICIHIDTTTKMIQIAQLANKTTQISGQIFYGDTVMYRKLCCMFTFVPGSFEQIFFFKPGQAPSLKWHSWGTSGPLYLPYE